MRAAKDSNRRRNGAQDTVGVFEDEVDEVAHIHLPRMSIAAMHQQEERGAHGGGGPAPAGAGGPKQRPEDLALKQRPVESVPEGPWRPFARFKKDRQEELARQPTSEERDALLNGDWIRHFYLFPQAEPAPVAVSGVVTEEEEPYAFVYHAQPGRTGAVFLTSDFPMHSAVFSMLERQFFVVNQVDTLEGADITCAMSLLKAKGHPELRFAFHALQDIVAYDTNMMKQQRTPGTVSVYQAPRSAYSCNGEPFLYVRWFRFNADRSLSAFLLSNGAVQVFVKNEYELRWFDENRKFLIRYNGVCELVNEDTFALAPAINHLLYDSFDAENRPTHSEALTKIQEFISARMPTETFREHTLATRYQPRQHLPPNFSDVLKEYAREVLRSQPSDILEWSAAYFKKLALETDPLQAKQPPPDHYTPLVDDPERAMLANKMVKVFSTMDLSETGRLPVSEVRRTLTEAFELTESQALYLITAPFTTITPDDGNGVAGDFIEYSSFSHAAVRTIQYFQQHQDFLFCVDANDANATVHGMNRYDVEQGFLRIFRLLDEAGTGRLLLQDYHDALKNAPYHLTHRDIRVLLLECGAFGEEECGKSREVEYEKELPHMFERLLLAEVFHLFDEGEQS